MTYAHPVAPLNGRATDTTQHPAPAKLLFIAVSALSAFLFGIGSSASAAGASDSTATSSQGSGVITGGGRIVIESARVAVTLPADWTALAPSSDDMAVLTEYLAQEAPELAPFLGEMNFTLVALAPIALDATFVENCLLDVGDAPGTLGITAAGLVAALRELPYVVGEPRLTDVQLNAGSAARIDFHERFASGPELAVSAYVLIPDERAYVLTCTNVAAPKDHWLRIASTLEVLGTPGTGPVAGPPLDGTMQLIVDPSFLDPVGRVHLTAVAQGATDLVAVGAEPRGGAVWRSADGITWSRQAFHEPLQSAVMTDIAWADHGFVAIGYWSPDRVGQPWEMYASIWQSVDGSRWDRVRTVPDADALRFDAVWALDSGTYVVAAQERATGDPVVLESGDGQTWERSKVVLPPYLREVTRVRDGLFIGLGVDGLMTSPDGIAWEAAVATSGGDESETGVDWPALGSHGGVAYRLVRTGATAYLEASTDGSTWGRLSDQHEDLSGMADIAGVDGRLVAVGTGTPPETPPETVIETGRAWILDPAGPLEVPAPSTFTPARCPKAGKADLATIISLGPSKSRQCFGAAQLRFRAWVPETGPTAGPDCDGALAWLRCRGTFVQPVQGLWPMSRPLLVHSRTSLDVVANTWVEITGHFDHPAARRCPPDSHCRDQFVATRVRRVGGGG
jgi:hypothetical protein